MPKKTLDLHYPLAGVVRQTAYADYGTRRAAYGTPWAMNCRAEDSLTSRLRGGSFAGISAGSRPSAIVYRGRTLTFAGRAITASRVGNSMDTAMSADVSDLLRPALFQFSEAGQQGGSVVALVPHKDHYLLGFTATQTWIQRGDPLTGQRQRVSDRVGIVGANAWCVAHDTVYFLSSLGLYSVNADGGELKALSEETIPADLTGVTDANCTLTYQHSDRGVYIHKTGTDWYYDAERNAYWPFDTSKSSSHVLLGPFRLGGPDSLGIMQTLHGVIAQGSTTVNWAVIPGSTAEEAAVNGKAAIEAFLAGTSYASYIRASGSWSAGRSQTARPRVGAMWAVIWLSSSGTWAFEGCTVGIEPSGEWRK